MPTTPPTCAEALAEATRRLAAAGVPEPRVDAEWLLCEVLGLRRTELQLKAQQQLSSEQAAAFAQLLGRREAREPLAYLLGSQEFLGLDLLVDPRALIPRWDSEALVERLAAEFQQHPSPTLADLGTGSGALAIGLATLLPRAVVHAVELVPETLDLARANVERHGLRERVKLHPGDLAEPLLAAGLAGAFDAVLSNPPYIPSDIVLTLEPEVRQYEPLTALDGGPDGLDLIRRLGPAARKLLKQDGLLLVESGSDQTAAAAEALGEGWRHLETVPDLGGAPRGILMQRIGP